MERDHILVVGGYGVVGQTICQQLSIHYPGRVYAAGRSIERAEAFCRTTNGAVKPYRLDVSRPLQGNELNGIRVVIMCLDQQHYDFLRACLHRGVRYTDVTATSAYVLGAESLRQEAKQCGTAAILSVGLAPGLTNLLTREAASRLDRVDHIDLAVMLGLGDRHGEAAIAWTLAQLTESFTVMERGAARTVKGFTDGQTFDFGHRFGRKRAYRFDFPDQHVLPRTLGVPGAATRLCFDSEAATRTVAALRAAGLLSALRSAKVRQKAARLAGRLRFGSDSYAVKAEATGVAAGRMVKVEALLSGNDEARTTALVAAQVGLALYRERMPPGIHHIEQLMTLDQFADPLRDVVRVEVREDGGDWVRWPAAARE